MSRHEVGIDLIDIDRIVRVLGKFPHRFRERVLTDRERRYVGGKVERHMAVAVAVAHRRHE